jgi:hypothetical protein
MMLRLLENMIGLAEDNHGATPDFQRENVAVFFGPFLHPELDQL